MFKAKSDNNDATGPQQKVHYHYLDLSYVGLLPKAESGTRSICNHIAPEVCDHLRRLESSLSSCPCIFDSSSSKIRERSSWSALCTDQFCSRGSVYSGPR